MDLIIELIVWIVKSLAGEDEKKKTGTGGGAAAPSTKRGPYNYGDGKPGAAGKPRTLEEILEEVKRQQAQGKAGAQKPTAQRAAAPAAAPAKVKAPSLSRPLSEVQQPTAARAAAPAPLPSHQGGSIQSSIERRELKQTLDQREYVKPGLERKFEKISEREDQRGLGIGHTKMVAQVDTVTTMGEVQTVSSMESNLADKRTNTFADFFKSIRMAPMKSRSEMARRAFVFSEVFGPPRCRGRHRR